MEHYTLTITREFGSMGRSIAKRLSELLGVAFYDRDIVEDVAKRLNLPVSTISSTEEKMGSGFFYRMFPLGTDERYVQDMIYDVQKDIILDLAGKESCILVGRCSDHLLEHRKNNINVYIYAPYAKRLENCVTRLGMSEEEAKRTIHSVDKARQAYHKRYAGYLPADTAHKQFCIDSSVLGVDGTAELLAEIVRARFGEKA